MTKHVISRAVVVVVHFTFRAAANQANGRSHHRTNDTRPTLITNVAPPPFPGCPQRPPQHKPPPPFLLPSSAMVSSFCIVSHCSDGVKRCTSMKIVKIPHHSPTFLVISTFSRNALGTVGGPSNISLQNLGSDLESILQSRKY